MISLQIETVSTCNAACSFCVYPQVAEMRRGQVMDMDLYKSIIDQAVETGKFHNVKLTGLGEPTLDRFLEERVKYASGKGLYTQIYTNGVPLVPARHDSLRAAGLDSIVFSLNAVRADQYKEIMGIDKFDRVMENITHAILNRGDKHVEVHAVHTGDTFTAADQLEFYRHFGDARDGSGVGLVISEGNWAGDNRTQRDFSPNECCHRATQHLYIMVDGRISTCCFDPTGKQIFGDLTKQTIKEAYNAEPYVAFRKAHSEDRADLYEICRTCTRI